MAITPNFTPADVDSRFSRFFDTIESRQIKRLQYLGEMCVKQARQSAPPVSFMDQTGNLRSSIGYTIFKDGAAIHQDFKSVKGGSEGVKAGQVLASNVGSKSKGICLVVVAGMNYAIYVEATGRDVLASAEHLAEKELPEMIKELVANINKAIE